MERKSEKPYLEPLERLADEAVLHKRDKDFAREILGRLRYGNIDETADLWALLDQSDSIRRKVLSRLNARDVSIMSEVNKFSQAEKNFIIPEVFGVELNDGCTGGCNFCGALSLRDITSRAEEESLIDFFSEFNFDFKYVPNAHWNSDFFDWMNKNDTGVELMNKIYRKTGSHMPITTSVPPGTELTVLRYLLNRQSDLEGVDPQRFQDYFVVSVRKENQESIRRMLRLGKFMGLRQSFLDHFLKTYDITNDENIYKIGAIIGHPDRDEYLDARGISCIDGVVLSLVRNYTGAHYQFQSIAMEATTLYSPTGHLKADINPGKFELPVKIYHINEFRNPFNLSEDDRIFLFTMLPVLQVMEITNGKMVGMHEDFNIRREAFAFRLLIDNLISIKGWIDGDRELTSEVHPQRNMVRKVLNQLKQNLLPEFRQRADVCKRMFATETDNQAVRVVQRAINEIENWYVDNAYVN
jgi:hypothetical protein